MRSNHNLRTILQASAEAAQVGNNDYALSCLDTRVSARYPDEKSSLAFPKTILIANEYKVEDWTNWSRDLRFITKQSGQVLDIGVQRMYNGRWYHIEYIQPAERVDDPEKYIKRRVVSRSVSYRSSTVPIGSTQLNGAMNAVRMLYTPKGFTNLGYDQLLPYSENDRSQVGNTPIHLGIMTLDVPVSSNPFCIGSNLLMWSNGIAVIPQTLQYSSVSQRMYRSNSDDTSKFFKLGHFSMDRTTSSHPQYDPLSADFNELYGIYRFTLESRNLRPEGEGEVTYMLRVHMRSLNQGTIYDYHDFVFMELDVEPANGGDIDMPIHKTFTFQSFNDIEGIEIVGDSPLIGVQTITIEKLRTSDSYDTNPMVVTTLTGLDPGQVISIQGIINLEAVPGSELRADLKPQDTIGDGHDIVAARNLRCALRGHYGYDYLSTIEDYREMIKIVRDQDLTKRHIINKAFIGAVLPMLARAAELGVKYGPAVYEAVQKYGPTMIEAGKNLYNHGQDMYTHMLQPMQPQPGRVLNRNKALMGCGMNQAQINPISRQHMAEWSSQHLKRNYAMVEPEKKTMDEPEKKEDTPVKRNLAMIKKAGRTLFAAKKREELVKGQTDKEVEPNIPFVTQRNLKGSHRDFSGFRNFPVIEVKGTDMQPIRARVHVSKHALSSDAVMQTTKLIVRNREITIHVQGLANEFDNLYEAASLNSLKPNGEPDPDMPKDVNRVLQFAARLCRDKGDDEIWFMFRAENGVPIEDFSFSAALESILFGLNPDIICMGDSCPNMDYNVEQNMSEDTIEMKMSLYSQALMYVKADTTTQEAITVPPGIFQISVDFDTMPEGLPAVFSCDNILPVMQAYPEQFQGEEGGSVKIIERVVHQQKKNAPMTKEEREKAALDDPFLSALSQYADNKKQFRGLRTLSFVPMTDNKEVDEFVLAVKNPKMLLTPEAARTALPYLEKYVACRNLPELHAKTFKRAYKTLSELEDPMTLNEMTTQQKSALENYVATGHPVSGDSLIWDARIPGWQTFSSTNVQPIADNQFVIPQVAYIRQSFLPEKSQGTLRTLDYNLYSCLGHQLVDDTSSQFGNKKTSLKKPMSHKEVKKSTVRENSPKAFKKDYKNPERTVRKFSGFKSESDSDDDR